MCEEDSEELASYGGPAKSLTSSWFGFPMIQRWWLKGSLLK